MIEVRPVDDGDRAWVVQVETDSWGTPIVARLGELIDPTELPGFVALLDGERAGLASYAVRDEECELVTIRSLHKGRGVGRALLDARTAARAGCGDACAPSPQAVDSGVRHARDPDRPRARTGASPTASRPFSREPVGSIALLVAGNWKMFSGPDPAELAAALRGVEDVNVVVAPPYTRLDACVTAGLTTFAQNVHWEADGPFTGEISAPMLLELGVTGSIVGHSERRQFFGETDAGVARRAHAALAAGLHVIACVGETQEERDGGDTEIVLRIQVDAIREACGGKDGLVLAYEPVWAIGTGRTATPELAQEAHAFIKSLLDRPVLYGGSVKPENAEELMAQPDVDGALVGGASLDVDSFASICRAAARSRS